MGSGIHIMTLHVKRKRLHVDRDLDDIGPHLRKTDFKLSRVTDI